MEIYPINRRLRYARIDMKNRIKRFFVIALILTCFLGFHSVHAWDPLDNFLDAGTEKAETISKNLLENFFFKLTDSFQPTLSPFIAYTGGHTFTTTSEKLLFTQTDYVLKDEGYNGWNYDNQIIRFLKTVANWTAGILSLGIFAFVIISYFFTNKLTEARDNPFWAFIKFILSLIAAYYGGYIMREFLYLAFFVWKNLAAETTPSDNVGSNLLWQIFGGSSAAVVSMFANLAVGGLMLIVVLVFVWIIVKHLLRLYAEVAERYVVMCVLVLMFPAVLPTMISKNTVQILKAYMRMFIAQVFLMLTGTIFFNSCFYMFLDGITLSSIMSYMFTLALLRTGQRLDSHLASLGLNVAQTGGALFDSIAGAGYMMMSTLRGANNLRVNAGGMMQAKGLATGNQSLYRAGAQLGASVNSMVRAGGFANLGNTTQYLRAMGQAGLKADGISANTAKSAVSDAIKNPTMLAKNAMAALNKNDLNTATQSLIKDAVGASQNKIQSINDAKSRMASLKDSFEKINNNPALGHRDTTAMRQKISEVKESLAKMPASPQKESLLKNLSSMSKQLNSVDSMIQQAANSTTDAGQRNQLLKNAKNTFDRIANQKNTDALNSSNTLLNQIKDSNPSEYKQAKSYFENLKSNIDSIKQNGLTNDSLTSLNQNLADLKASFGSLPSSEQKTNALEDLDSMSSHFTSAQNSLKNALNTSDSESKTAFMNSATEDFNLAIGNAFAGNTYETGEQYLNELLHNQEAQSPVYDALHGFNIEKADYNAMTGSMSISGTNEFGDHTEGILSQSKLDNNSVDLQNGFYYTPSNNNPVGLSVDASGDSLGSALTQMNIPNAINSLASNNINPSDIGCLHQLDRNTVQLIDNDGYVMASVSKDGGFTKYAAYESDSAACMDNGFTQNTHTPFDNATVNQICDIEGHGHFELAPNHELASHGNYGSYSIPLTRTYLDDAKIEHTDNYMAKNRELYCQDIVGNIHLYAGLIFTDSGDCIDIIEIQPINYYQKSPVTQKDILMSYISLQRILPDFAHFKVRMEAPGISALVNNMYQRTTTNEQLLAQAQEQAEKIESLRNENAKRRKYYLIYKYEGKKFDKNEIVDEMYETRTNIVNAINNMGHMVTTPNPEIINELIGETLYRHFNPKSSIEQDFRSRLMRLFNDEELYNRTHQKEKHFNDCDFVTQRGIRIVGSQAIISDGIYHTYLIIEDTSYPTNFHGVDYLTTLLKKINGLDYDIDTYSVRKNRGLTLSLLKQTKKFNTLSSNEAKNEDKQLHYHNKAAIQSYVVDALENKDEDFFDCFTFITIREKTYDKLMKKKRSVITTLKQYSVYVEETHDTALDMYKMAMPFMHINKQIFQKNSRNFLSESMPFFYWYTTSEFSDDSGIVIGINALNSNSIASINPFNASLHVNPHMAILGTSGAGKTYFQQMIARRLYFSNVKCMFIIPAKGYEYRDSCLALGGSYIKIAPGSGVCINPMEIRPLHNYDNETSLLSMKVISLTTLLQFLVKGDLTTTELARFPVVVKSLYKEFGITDDNDSLFDSEHS